MAQCLSTVGFLSRLRRPGTGGPEILDRSLLVLTPDIGEELRGPEILEEALEIDVVLVTDYDGLSVLPAFTSEAALLRWRPHGSRYIAVQGKVVVDLLARNDWDRIVVDTGSPGAFAITRSDAVRLLGS